jgi:hypothetical protein
MINGRLALLQDFGYKPPVRTVRQGMPWPFLTLETSLVSRFRISRTME